MANRFNVKVPVSRDPLEAETATAHVKELAAADYEAEVTAAPLPVVLDFYATDSKACELLAPRYAAVAGRYAGKVRFLKILRQGNAELAAKLGVSASPTLVFFRNGQELGERLAGEAIERTQLKARVEALLA